MTRPHETVLEFTYDSPASASRVARSVRVEAGDIDGDRTTASVDRDGDTVTVTVVADDVTALRAGCATWLHLVGVAEGVAGVDEQSV